MQASQESTDRLATARLLSTHIDQSGVTDMAVVGSVSRGRSNADSDVELFLWSPDHFGKSEDRRQWLSRVFDAIARHPETSEFVIDGTAIADGSHWLSFKNAKYWYEVGSNSVAGEEALLSSLLNGDLLAHAAQVHLDALFFALPVGEASNLYRWRQSIANYPLRLQEMLVQSALDEWSFPLHLEACWRSEPDRYGTFLEFLLADVHSLLRVIFSINKVYEPDWKNLEHRINGLTVKPTNLPERVHEILRCRDTRPSRRKCYELILEVLNLVPILHDAVGQVAKKIENTLKQNAG